MKNSEQEIIDIIDEQNRVVGNCTKKELYLKKHLHRIVHVLIFNNKGELLLQLRSKNKSYLPEYWGTSVGGHTSSGESPEEAAIREMQEELGIQLKLEPYVEDWFDSVDEIDLRKLLVTFKANSNGPFRLFKDEVEKVKFFSIDEIKRMISTGKRIHPELKFLVEKCF